MKEQSKQVPIQKLEVYVESVAMENLASSADRSHALFVVIGKIGEIIHRQCVDLYCLAINIKHVSQYLS